MRRLGYLVPAATTAVLLAAPAAASAYRDGEVRAALESAGFGSIADRVVESSLPTVVAGRRLLDRTPRARGTSRLGGNPDLPEGARWPRCAGRAQTFLGQIRLSDLPIDAAPLRDQSGVLLVFTEVRFTSPRSTGYGLWAGRCTTVVHAPEGARLVRTRPPRRAAVMRLRPAALRFRMRPDVPDTGMDLERLAAPLQDIRIADDQLEDWWELGEALHRRPGLLEHRLLGHMGTPNGETRCWRRSQRREGAWRHLLTIGADWRVGFDVADTGRLQVAIPPADLWAGRFDRVCGSFDSA